MNMREKFNPTQPPTPRSWLSVLGAWVAKWFARKGAHRWYDGDGAHRGLWKKPSNAAFRRSGSQIMSSLIGICYSFLSVLLDWIVQPHALQRLVERPKHRANDVAFSVVVSGNPAGG